MPISLIRSNKDNVVHGSDNGKTTGCRMRCQSVGYTKEGEMKDIVDLTCDRCKEYFARKMIRESNREEARITKEEKKRFEKAKKQGMVKEASFEEYQINREFEESERKATQGQRSNMTASQQMMQNGGYQYFGNDNAGPAENNQLNDAPSFNGQAPLQPENNAYGQTQSQPAPENGSSIPVYQPYNAYGQGTAPTQSQQFNAYGQDAVQPQSQQFGAYGQNSAPTQSQQFGAYGQNSAPTQSQQFGAYGQNSAQPQSQQFSVYEQDTVQTQSQQFSVYGQDNAAQTQSQQFNNYGQTQSYQSYENKKTASKSDDDFLSQFMVDPAVVSVQSQAPVKESVNTSGILSAANDILSQYNTEPVQPTGIDNTPKTPSFNGDAASFYSNQVPIVDSGFPSIESLTNSSNEFGSIISQDSYSDIPVVQAPADTYVKAPQTSQINTAAAPSYTAYSSQNYAQTANQFETVAPPNVYGNSSNVQSFENLGPIGEDAFASLSKDQYSSANTTSVPTIDTISPIDTSSLYGQNSSDMISAQTQNQSGFVMPSMDQPSVQPEMYQPSYAAAEPEEKKAPKIPVYTPPVYNSQQFNQQQDTYQQSAQNTYQQPAQNAYQQPAQNAYQQPAQNAYQQPAQNAYQQPAQNAYQQPAQNAYQQPVQNAYQQPAQNAFNQFVSQPAQPKMPQKQAVRNDVPLFNNSGSGEMADSIEAALRQLGAEGMSPSAPNGQNNMPEKEEIVPNYVAYVSSASKVLHNAPPANTAQTSAPKKMMSAREAKKMAKIDEKFYQDLKKRGFANEMRSQRRGK